MLERADFADSFFDPEAAAASSSSLDDQQSDVNARLCFTISMRVVHARRGAIDEARRCLRRCRSEDARDSFLGLSHRSTRDAAPMSRSRPGQTEARALAEHARQRARQQGATRWRRDRRTARRYCGSAAEFGAAIKSVGSVVALECHVRCRSWFVGGSTNLTSRCISVIERGARLHPGRWRFVLRDRVGSAQTGEGLDGGAPARAHRRRVRHSATSRLREAAAQACRAPQPRSTTGPTARRPRRRRGSESGRRSRSGSGRLPGSAVRRKVLALLCFLLTKPDMSSTRDQVLDALWPELDPGRSELPQSNGLLPAACARGATTSTTCRPGISITIRI